MGSMRYSASNLSSQKGAVLLLFALLLLIGSTYSLVSKLNSDTNFYVRQSKETQESLRLAKQALIAYALSFPEIDALSGTDKINGPGYLPCPDINNNGSAGGTCSSGGNTTIGRFPNNTLETADLRDSSGSRLWYALSDNFRNSAGLEPLNSETPGQLTVDGNNDIVAVVIAPGAPVGNQNRNPADTNILTEIANYLETENNDLDLSFISVDPSSIDFTDFNDRLVSITRQELMEQIEKRVLGEAKIFLETYKTTYGAYPWLSSFADPKTNEKRPTGSHSGSDDQANLTDSSANFTLWGVANGDVVWNITDGSYGVITAFTSTTLTVGAGLTLGSENDFDTNDEYYIDINSPTYSTSFTGTAVATGGSGGFILEDTTKNFVALGVQIGDIVELVADGSSGVIETVTSTQLTVGTLIGTTTAFSNGNVYRIRSSIGRATADSDGNGLTLDDTNVDFTVMGIQAGELIRNTTDGSYGRISVVSANRLTVDDLLFGVDNTFSNNDYYSLPRLNGVTNIREGLIGIHEAGEAFKTRINFDWAITANALDVTVLNSGILQNTMQTYAASGSEVFDDSVGTCIWRISNFADCFVSFKDFVNISGNLTSGSDTDVITDSGALFNTNAVKRGDIAQNYDDETLVVSGTVDAGNSGTTTGAPTTLTLQDTNNDFINVNIAVGDTVFNTTDGSSGIIDSVAATQITVASLSGGADNIFETGDGYQIGTEPTLYDASANFTSYERYNYLVQNQTLESELGVGKIQAILADKEGVDTLIAESYVGESSTPMEFRPGDSYRIYQPRQFVIQSVASETQLTTDNYTSGTNPDFDNGEYYRVMPAANSQNATLDWQTTSGGQDILIDISADFVNDGVEVGDIVENHAGAFGEITSLSGQVIWTVLYGGSSQSFSSGNQYTVYYDYVYSRRHTIHAKFQGTQATKTVTEERVRDVCLGYNADCTAVSSAVNFTGNTGVPLFSIQDYQEDETTEVGSATFTPSALSSGSLLVSNINFGLSEANGDFPAWFTNNDWHKLMYIAYSAGDAPGAAAACIAGADCITLNELDINDATVFTNNANNAVVIAAGREINTIQDSNCNGVASTAQNRSSGTINEYYELENCSAGDDSFREQYETNTFNDQVRIVEP
tara:strand:- start:946 stop:4338 length:3393 start_codon:yes stop_codon:yes gene_type:complete